MKEIRKVVLAYSGGLDTSVIIPWLRERYGCEVIAFVADLGQFDFSAKSSQEIVNLKKKALKSGASRVYVDDLKEIFVQEYIFPTLQANAIYEGKYLLSAALSRPLIAKRLVEIAQKEKADAVAHGCTGKGNDQVRFELTVRALNPKLKIIAPLREWEMTSREEEIQYARKHGIPVPVKTEKPYSIDKNIWGVSIECGELEDPFREPPEDAYQITVSPEKAPANASYVEIDFERGIPRKIDGVEYSSVELIKRLNRLGGEYGIGRADIVEDRVVGIKSREIYEAPGATILFLAHRDLENLTLDRDIIRWKELVALKYAELVYCGFWESPLKKAMDAFVSRTQERVSGRVRVKLYKGNLWVVGRKSPYQLYRKELATYGPEDSFNHSSAGGFIELFGLPLEIFGLINRERKK